jgi:dinuclear metal center YbgI/SA1388 family protein
MLCLDDVLDYLEKLAPLSLAEEWDNVGLLLGERTRQVERIMTCLTVTPESAAEAIEEGAGLVVSHHPVLFRPVQRLTDANPEGRMLLGLIRAGVAVYSPHTAFDNASGGINDLLAERLGLSDVRPLRTIRSGAECKVVVFVPESDLGKVSDALFNAGAGRIGQYRECSFRVPGTGTFFGLDSTNPAIGQKGRHEEVSEWRLEVVCPADRLDPVIAAMRRAHSYEEPAFDLYPLGLKPGTGGSGRVGSLRAPVALQEFAERVQKDLNASHIQVVGDLNRTVRSVAIACGAGGEFRSDAIQAKADVFLTGEMRFHDYLAAQTDGLALLLPGHYATERPGVERLAERLQQQWPQLKVWASHREQDPVASRGA